MKSPKVNNTNNKAKAHIKTIGVKPVIPDKCDKIRLTSEMIVSKNVIWNLRCYNYHHIHSQINSHYQIRSITPAPPAILIEKTEPRLPIPHT